MAQKKEIPITNEIKMIKLEDIKSPSNPVRTNADDNKFEELVNSIKRFGLIQPIVVYQRGKMYEIVAGHRRYLACKILAMQEIAAQVRTADEVQRDIIKLHENTVREDINPIDQAHYFKFLVEKYQYTHDELAEMIGKSRPYVSNIMRILNYPPYIQEAIEREDLTYNIASILMQIDDEGTREIYLGHAIKGGISQEMANTWVENWKIAKEAQKTGEAQQNNQEPQAEQVYHPPTCYYCGKSSRELPLEAMLVCTQCKFNLRDMIAAMGQKTP